MPFYVKSYYVLSVLKLNNTFLLTRSCFFQLILKVPSHVLMGILHGADAVPLSPLGEACLRMDLTAIHEVLEKIGYKDDEGAATEVRFLSEK